MTVRTRMAPSPTGEYHIGSMRTLLFNYAYAKQQNGQFILRIEDTDRERFVEGSTERLIEVIKDYGLSWDEGPEVEGPYGPYVQSQRLEIYKERVKELIEKGHAYYCFCSKERLDNLRETQKTQGQPTTKYDKKCLSLSSEEIAHKLETNVPYVVRLNVPSEQEIKFTDRVLGEIVFNTKDLDDQILLKSDGFPTYHLAVVVDDYLMKISVIMRGMEWLPSTPKHILLYKAFGWEVPEYAHVPLLKEKGDTKKLSKRMGSVGARDFLNEGYLPEALLNFLMFLGWNPGTEKEIYSLNEFIKDFSIERLQKTDLVVFDRDKLLWYNGYYIRNMDLSLLHKRLKLWARDTGIEFLNSTDETRDLKILDLVRERLRTFSEYSDAVSYFYNAPQVENESLIKFAVSGEKATEILIAFKSLYEEVSESEWKTEPLDKYGHTLIEQKGYKPKEAFMTLRTAITGRFISPPIFEVLEILGRKEVLSRINTALSILK